MPAIARHHYCNPEESFWDEPHFREQKELKRSIEFVDCIEDDEKYLWDDSLVGLGSKFAICGGRVLSYVGGCEEAMALDLEALTALCEVGTKIDLPSLIQRLQSPIQIQDEELDSMPRPRT